jgi:hypothetical protein
MQIRWSSGENREDHMIFDSLWEAEEWADSIRGDIIQGVFDGYTTPDQKVAFALAYYLAESAHYLAEWEQFIVYATKTRESDKFMYKVWVTRTAN